MSNLDYNFQELRKVMRRRLWILVLTPILVAALTYVFTSERGPTYEARALIKVSKVATNLQSLLIEVLNQSQGDNIETQTRLIGSQMTRLEVAREMARLGRHSLYSRLDPDRPAEEILEDPTMVAVIDAMDLRAERVGESDIVSILVRADSEDLAVDTANVATRVFIRQNSSERSRQIEQAVEFIRQRISRVQNELATAEESLREFEERHSDSLTLSVEDFGDLGLRIDRGGRTAAALAKEVESLRQVSTSADRITYSPQYIDVDDDLASRLETQILNLMVERNALRADRAKLLESRTEESREVKERTVEIGQIETRIQETVASLILRYEGIRKKLLAQVGDLSDREARLRSLPEIHGRHVALQRDLGLKTNTLETLQTRLQDAEIQRAGEVREISEVEKALKAGVRHTSSRANKALVGLFMGLLLGGVFAFVLENLDTSISSVSDVERSLQIPVVGVIPGLERSDVISGIHGEDRQLQKAEIESFSTLCTHFAPTLPFSESFRTLRTQLDVLFKRHDWRTLLVTSSVLEEGKTTVASNLAIVLAQSGVRTLLVDADLRRPMIHRLFGIEPSPGLSEVLLGVGALNDTVRSVEDLILGRFGLANTHSNPGLEYLHILTAGRGIDSPGELLNPGRVSSLLTEVGDQFEAVIIDAPPLLTVSDASVLCPQVDATLLVHQTGGIGREIVHQSKTRIESLGALLIGVVLNAAKPESAVKGASQTKGRTFDINLSKGTVAEVPRPSSENRAKIRQPPEAPLAEHPKRGGTTGSGPVEPASAGEVGDLMNLTQVEVGK